jgi:glutathione synthase/RimK-type ligase-like ATP-grasp enzyme
MLLAIDDRTGGFAPRWIEYCRERALPLKLVHCTDSNIISQLANVDALLWQPVQLRSEDMLMAHCLVMALEAAGKLVYPNTSTFWHFDDKLAQKYLLEATGAPLVATHVFFDAKTAIEWIERTKFPKVFKLRRGAGSSNVGLVRDASEAKALVRTAFGRGFQPVPSVFTDVGVKFRQHRKRADIIATVKRLPRLMLGNRAAQQSITREKGYVCFQDFLPGNAFDTRITVIGKRAFGFTRNVRPNDFRASGSGDIVYDLARIDLESIRIAFKIAKRLAFQSMAFDFLKDTSGAPKLCEISFAFAAGAVAACAGWWDESLDWHEGSIWPQDAILEDMLEHIREIRSTQIETELSGIM